MDENNILDDKDKELKAEKREEDFIFMLENSQDGEEKENENQETLNESEEIKKYNDVNYWKNEISKNDDMMNEILNDLD